MQACLIFENTYETRANPSRTETYTSFLDTIGHMNPNTKHIPFTLLCTIAIFTSQASAGPGPYTQTDLIVFTHVLFGSFLLGIIEWIVLAKFGASKIKSAIMIPATYIASGVCAYIIFETLNRSSLFGENPVSSIYWVSIALFIIFIALGYLVKLPFYLASFGKPYIQKRSLILSSSIHLMTSAIVVLYYIGSSNISLATKFESVSYQEILDEYQGPQLSICFIDQKNRSLKQFHLHSSTETILGDVDVESFDADQSRDKTWLELRNEIGSDELDLFFVLSKTGWMKSEDEINLFEWHKREDHNRQRLIIPDLAIHGTTWPQDYQSRHRHSTLDDTPASDLRTNKDLGPSVTMSNWLDLRPLNVTTPDGTTHHYGLTNLFIDFNAIVQDVTIIDGDLIIFTLGSPFSNSTFGIYIASLRTHKIAKITDGRSPLVLIDNTDMNQSSSTPEP